jgi:hypothetical protein
LPFLNKLDMGYVSNIGYKVKRRTTDSEIQYSLSLEPLSAPFQIEYDWDWADAEDFLSHLDAGALYGVFLGNTYNACDATGHETVQLEREGTADPQINATDPICAGMVELSFAEESNSVDIHSLYVHRHGGVEALASY